MPTAIDRPAWQDALIARWYSAHPVWLLIPFAWLFRWVVAVRTLGFRSGWFARTCLPVPVLVVGNLVVGGAGKTPAVMAVVQALRARGLNPGVLSRGYGGSATAPRLVTAADDPAVCGDEAVLLADALAVPLAIGARRVAAGQLLLQAHPAVDCLVCDDGLQHLALDRTVELVVIDRARGLGNGWCLPAGPLREPVSRLEQVDALLLHGRPSDPHTRVTLPAGIPQGELSLVMLPPRRLTDNQQAGDWAAWQGRTVHAVAGIGHPERFFSALRALGLIVHAHSFPDHHAFCLEDLRFAEAWPILLTSKDAVKCRGFQLESCWSVPLQAQLPDSLADSLAQLMERPDGCQTA